MGHEPFDMRALLEIDNGDARAAWEDELDKAIRHLRRLPHLGRARTVSLQLKLSPIVGADGRLAGINRQVVIPSASVPSIESPKVSMGVSREGKLLDVSPEHVDQRPLSEVAGQIKVGPRPVATTGGGDSDSSD